MDNIKSFILSSGDIIENRYKIKYKISKGGFGEVYSAFDTKFGQDVAIKVESRLKQRQVSKMEAYILKKLQKQKHICKIYEYGRTEEFNFIVMELQGKSLSELRKQSEGGIFSLGVTFRLALQMLEAIEELHKNGFLHRDIKPGNFVLGNGGPLNKNGRNLFIIDFGLSRQFISDKTLNHKSERPSAPFRGTVRYASINSHRNKDVGRRDDLWSLFYIIVEFITGTLPWHKMRHKGYVGKIKEKFHQNLVHLPITCRRFMEHINSLKFSDSPNYRLLNEIIIDGLTKIQVEETILNGWNLKADGSLSSSSSIAEIDCECLKEMKECDKTTTDESIPNRISAILSCISLSTNITNLPSIEEKPSPKRCTSPFFRRNPTSRVYSADNFTRQIILSNPEPEQLLQDSTLGTSAINLQDTLKDIRFTKTPVQPVEPYPEIRLISAARMRRYYLPTVE